MTQTTTREDFRKSLFTPYRDFKDGDIFLTSYILTHQVGVDAQVVAVGSVFSPSGPRLKLREKTTLSQADGYHVWNESKKEIWLWNSYQAAFEDPKGLYWGYRGTHREDIVYPIITPAGVDDSYPQPAPYVVGRASNTVAYANANVVAGTDPYKTFYDRATKEANSPLLKRIATEVGIPVVKEDKITVELTAVFHREQGVSIADIEDWLQGAWRNNPPCGLSKDLPQLMITGTTITKSPR